jgi:phage nucleotide-binding protein
MSIIDKITPVKHLPKVLSMLVYGRSGTGKTTFAGSFPGPILLIDIREKGTDSLSNMENIDVVFVENWSEVEEIFWYLKTGEGATKYKSVILDQVSSLQDLAMTHAMEEEGKEVMSQRLWGVVSGLMKTWLLNYRDLVDQGINVLFIAHDRTSKGESGEEDDAIDPQVGPRLMPSVAGLLNGAVKAIGNTYVKEVFLEDKSRRVEYCMRIGPHAYYTTKLRNPLGTSCPESLIDPKYDAVMKLMAEGEVKPVRRTISK